MPFQRYPNDIDKIISVGLSARMQGIVAISLKLAGQDAKVQSVIEHLQASGASAPDLRTVPSSLDAARVLDAIRHDKFMMQERKSVP